MFSEFNCGHFETKMKSLRPSCQKLAFCPYKEMGVAKKGCGHQLEKCSKGPKVWYWYKLMISGEKSIWAQNSTKIPIGPQLRLLTLHHSLFYYCSPLLRHCKKSIYSVPHIILCILTVRNILNS